MKYMTRLFAAFLCLFSFSASATMLSFKEFNKSFELGKNYFLIMEGYNIPGVVNRKGQYFCGSIAFSDESDESLLYYTFKAWSPIAGKCEFQSNDDVSLIAYHTCVQPSYRPKRSFNDQEIADTREGFRAIELDSPDDQFLVLSRCLKTDNQEGDTSYINLYNQWDTNISDREHKGLTVVEEMVEESRPFSVLEDDKKDVDVLTIKLNNAWKYVIIKDPTIN